jgi:hypothetical protein
MFNKGSKSSFVKVGGLILMGFFVIIIVISFGLPSDWMKGNSRDPNLVAKVNGERVDRLALARKVDDLMGQYRAQIPDEQLAYVLNMLIAERIHIQFAIGLGIEVSDDAVLKALHSAFTDPQTGVFNPMFMKRYLERVNLAVGDAIKRQRDTSLQSEMGKLLTYGAAPLSDEIAFQNAVDKSSFQIRYAFLSNADFQKKNGAAVTVTEAEIDAEMAANKKDIENPATDRAKFRNRIIDRKTSESKKSFVSQIDGAASKGEAFDKTASLLGGKTGTSDVFKAGDLIKEQGKDGKPLTSISDSEIFRNTFASLKAGASSKAIISNDGIYVFTPVKKDFKAELPAEKDLKAVTDKVSQVKQQNLQDSMFTPIFESAKIERFLKDQQ